VDFIWFGARLSYPALNLWNNSDQKEQQRLAERYAGIIYPFHGAPN
jgi:hypothetical protein